MVMRELIPTRNYNHFTSPSSSSSNEEDKSNLPDTVFWFLDEDYPSSSSSSQTSSSSSADLSDDAGNRDNDLAFNFYRDEETEHRNLEAAKLFWKVQEELIEAILCRKSSTESKIRAAVRNALRRVNNPPPESYSHTASSCAACVGGGRHCRSCLRREVNTHLRESGYDCSIKESKWKSTADIPAGDHTYLEVLTSEKSKSHTKKGDSMTTRVIIELNFQSEFEMGKTSLDYNKLISHLPEIFVGKPERMKGLVKILCGAAKRCVMEKGMHLGPWRKEKYVKSKWVLTGSTGAASTVVSAAVCESDVVGFGGRLMTRREDDSGGNKLRLTAPMTKKTNRGNSLLTFALSGNFPVNVAGGVHRQTVAVL